jgi:site-specific recombinase XerD
MQIDMFADLPLPIINLPAVIESPALPSTLRIALEDAADLASNSRAESTRRSYANDWKIFERWCSDNGLCSMPASPAAVAAFIADQVKLGRRASTLGRRVSAVAYRHKQGARRTIGTAQRKLAPATSEKCIGMATLVRPGLGGLRDRAILLLGFALAGRRSEIVSLNVEDLEECSEGLRVRIKRSKTDQEGQGAVVAVCRGSIADPVAAVLDYIKAAGLVAEQPLFVRIRWGNHPTGERLNAESIRKIVKSHAAKLGLNPNEFGAHSLRAGFATSCAARGANLFRLADATRHKSLDVLRGYCRNTEIFKDHPAEGLL